MACRWKENIRNKKYNTEDEQNMKKGQLQKNGLKNILHASNSRPVGQT